MSGLTVGRLTLQAGTMSESDARRLANLVAQALGDQVLSGHARAQAGSAAGAAGRTAGISLDVAQQPGKPIGEIAEAVAAAIAAAIREAGGR
jgi:hypothetical protein